MAARKNQNSTSRKKTEHSKAKKSSQTRSGITNGNRVTEDGANSEMKKEVTIWVLIALSVFGFISCLGFGGAFGGVIRALLFGVFGLPAYVIAPVIVFSILLLISNHSSKTSVHKVLGIALLMIAFEFFLELLRQGSTPSGAFSAYQYASTYHSGGGLIGGAISGLLVRLIGLAGAWIADIAFLIISVVLISQKSIIRELSRSKDQISARNEAHQKEQELKRQIRADERAARAEERLAALEQKRTEAAQHAQNAHDARREASREAMRNDTVITDTSKPGEVPKRRNRHVDGINFNAAIGDAVPAAPTDDLKELHINLYKEDDKTDVQRVNLSSENHEIPVTPAVTADHRPAAEPAEPLPANPTSEESSISIHAQDLTDDEIPDNASITDEESGIPAAQDEIPVEETETRDPEVQEASASDPVVVRHASVEPVAGNSSKLHHDISENERNRDVPDLPVAAAEAEKVIPREAYEFPPISLLNLPKNKKSGNSRSYLMDTAHKLETVLRNFGVNVQVTDVSCGPAVTRYEIQPEVGVKVSRIVNLADDIKLNLAASDIRIEAPIPSKAAVGIEVPNREIQVVYFRELMESEEFRTSKSNIAFALGRDIAGRIVISNIQKMPHLLIAGATGSGKSVCINTIIMSILYKAHPDDVKFIMIDPKVVELSVYNGIPHLLIPVVTDPKKAAGALHWAVREMTDRYQKFAHAGVRNIEGYNEKIHDGKIEIHVNGESMEIAAPRMPQIVVIVDELADLMMVSSSEVEEAIVRLTQLARAAGIHLIIATQRPSVNVITGLIKANMPSRIAFSVTSGVDSRTILDMVGAEKLLGKGDMLYFPQGYTKPLRVQGAFVSDDEVSEVVTYIREHNDHDHAGEEEIQKQIDEDPGMTAIDGNGSPADDRDQYFEEAARLIIGKEKASIGLLQRNFKIGFNRAARIMDQLQDAGVVGGEEGTKPRKVLMTMDQFNELMNM